MEIYEICSFTFVKAFNENEYGEGKTSATYSIMTNEWLDICWITNNNGELDYQEPSFKDGIDGMFGFLEEEILEREWKGAHVYVTINKNLALYSEKTLIEALIENSDYKLASAISLIEYDK